VTQQRVAWIVPRLAAFVVLLIGCWVVPGGSDDFRLDAVVGHALITGVDPLVPLTELGTSVPYIATRTPIGVALAAPLGLIAQPLRLPSAAIFVALTGLLFLHLLNSLGVSWWWATAIVVWPFSEVDRHGQTTFLFGALILAAVLTDGRPKLAGFLLALAVGLKLWPALIPLALFATGRRRIAAWTGIWFVALTTFLLAATSITLDGAVAALTQDIANPANLSRTPIWLIPPAVIVFFLWARNQPWLRATAWSIPAGLALSPVLWAAYLPVLAVPMVLLRNRPDVRTSSTNGGKRPT